MPKTNKTEDAEQGLDPCLVGLARLLARRAAREFLEPNALKTPLSGNPKTDAGQSTSVRAAPRAASDPQKSRNPLAELQHQETKDESND